MKPIPNFPDYFADEFGQIWSHRRAKVRRLSLFPIKDCLE